MRAHARVYAHAYKFYHGSSNTKTFGFASLVFELCSIFSFLLFCLLGVRALHRCFIKIPCFLVLCLNLNTYTDYRKKRGQKALRVRAKWLLWVFFLLVCFSSASVRANVVGRVGKCVLCVRAMCVQYTCTVWVLCVLCVGKCVRIGNFEEKMLQKKFWENVKEYTKIQKKDLPFSARTKGVGRRLG